MKISTLVIDSNEVPITLQTAFPNINFVSISNNVSGANLQRTDSGREDLSYQTNISKIHS